MDKVIEVVRVCDRIIKQRLILFNVTVLFISARASHVRLADIQKNYFYESFLQTVLMMKDIFIMVGNFYSLIIKHCNGFHGVHGSYGFDSRNRERTRPLMQMT